MGKLYLHFVNTFLDGRYWDFNPFPNEKFRHFQTDRSLQRKISILMKMAETSPNGYKTPWKKEKLLGIGDFSFFKSVFKKLDQGLFGKGLVENEKEHSMPPKSNSMLKLLF